MTPPSTGVAFVADDANPRAVEAARELRREHRFVAPETADVLVVVGGDGFMLRQLHRALLERDDVALYGLNRGTVGFLMNTYRPDRLMERIAAAETTVVHPIELTAADPSGRDHRELAINEIALLRSSPQSARLALHVDGDTVLEELTGDGMIVATSAGSTAYNRSAGGPVVPLDAELLAVTPLAGFLPRGWSGALLSASAHLTIDNLDPDKRPVTATADGRQLPEVVRVEVRTRLDLPLRLLFDPGHGLERRILEEQFRG